MNSPVPASESRETLAHDSHRRWHAHQDQETRTANRIRRRTLGVRDTTADISAFRSAGDRASCRHPRTGGRLRASSVLVHALTFVDVAVFCDCENRERRSTLQPASVLRMQTAMHGACACEFAHPHGRTRVYASRTRHTPAARPAMPVADRRPIVDAFSSLPKLYSVNDMYDRSRSRRSLVRYALPLSMVVARWSVYGGSRGRLTARVKRRNHCFHIIVMNDTRQDFC